MTRMTPLRRTILQCSQSFLTDARTFIFLFSIYDAAPRHVVGRHFHFHPVTRTELEPAAADPAGPVGQDTVPIGHFHPAERVGQDFNHPAFRFKTVVSWHVRISGPCAVTSTVCSKWADS